ncbi:Translation initiation factor eIF-2B subunit delta [Sarcoptes scabiei]|uniref:Translation initiation factor eIF2B subunit delta n=1 Tax=Sarcoptes scabiei TaxID=52283 RepID=A0A834VHP2_SARSC|nr:Translation initiation factor eIF-2B subunit delta [Sarcoptes scabiei]UXI17729.1 hypothetical protein NH340_JMT03672 [Sarcoptes scabiei]
MESEASKAMNSDEKAHKAMLKAQRKAEFEAKFKKEQENKKSEENTKSKSQLKAERRAKQEAQRAAKANVKSVQNQPEQASKAKLKTDVKNSDIETVDQQKKSSKSPEKPILNSQKDNIESKNDNSIIESHRELSEKILFRFPKRSAELSTISTAKIHHEVIKVGYKINQNIITDPTSRCVAMLTAFNAIIRNHQPVKDFKRELQEILFTNSYDFLNKCRPLSISMMNAIKHLKFIFSKISSDWEDDDIRENICSEITKFIEEEILCSRKAISQCSLKEIFSNKNGQTILTLGFSSLMKTVFADAIEKKIDFSVVVVDSRPSFEGKKMVEFLVRNNVPVTYILINAVRYIIKEVNKVMFEAHSVLCNGYVMSNIGLSQIALLAQTHNVPVVALCETFKYSDRAYTDCFVHNEIDDTKKGFFNPTMPEQIEQNPSSIHFLDLFYDLIPREFISAVITEKGFLPCTSVPAILRFRDNKIQ